MAKRSRTRAIVFVLFNTLLLFSSMLFPVVSDSYLHTTMDVEPVDLLPMGSSGYTISGNSVYYENDYCNISVYPHTSVGFINHKQEVALTWNWSDTNIDVVFRFPVQLTGYKDIQLLSNKSYTFTTSLVNITNFTSLGYTPSKVHLGDIPSDYYYNVTVFSNETGYRNFTVGFDSYQWDNLEHTNVSFSYTFYRDEWVSRKSSVQYTTAYGKHDYYITNIPVKQNRTYKARLFYGLPPGSSSGKFDFMAKLSSETIGEALSSGHYCMLDPWYQSGEWLYRKWISIDSSQVPSTQYNFPVLYYNSSDLDLKAHAQADGDDIIFVADDNTTQYFHDLVDWNSSGNGNIEAWINITSLTSATGFWMYYGNSSATNQRDADNTWDSNFIFVSHLNESSGNIVDISGGGYEFFPIEETGPFTGYQATGKIGYCFNFDGDVQFRNTTLPLSSYSEFAMECWYDPEIAYSSTNVDYWFSSLYFVTGPEDIRLNFYHGTGEIPVSNSGAYYGYDDNTPASNVEFVSDRVHDYETGFKYYATSLDADVFVYGYVNGTKVGSDTSVDFDIGGMDNDHCIGARNYSADEITSQHRLDGYMDEFRLHKDTRSDDWFEISYNAMNNISGATPFLNIGEEEQYSAGGGSTSVDEITPYWLEQETYDMTATASGDAPDNVTLWYRYSTVNDSWDSGSMQDEYKNPVDTNDSEQDAIEDIGIETDFANAQDLKDDDYMTLAENDTAGQDEKTAVVGNQTDVDSSPDIGEEDTFYGCQDTSPDPDAMYINESNTAGTGDESKTYVGGNAGNLDGSADVGTENNFVNAQDITPDSDYMELIEADLGTGVDESKYVDGLSGSPIWSTTGSSPYLDAVDASNIYTSANGLVGQWYTFADTSETGSGFIVALWAYYNNAGDSYPQWEIDWDNDGNADASGSFPSQASMTWRQASVVGLDTDTEINDARVRFIHNKGGGGPDLITIDASYIRITRSASPDYECDFEYNWSNLNYSDTYEELCFYMTGTVSEDLVVDYWNSTDSWTTLGNIDHVGWNNLSVGWELQNSSFYIRLYDENKSAESTQTSWQVDVMSIHTWNDSTDLYKADFEYNWSGLNYTDTYEELCFYLIGGVNEDLVVSYWHTGDVWSSLGNIESSGWTNFSISSSLSNSSYYIRIRDENQSTDTVMTGWTIDVISIHTWNASNYKLDFEYKWTTANYSATNETLCIYVQSKGSEDIDLYYWLGAWTPLDTITSTGWHNTTATGLTSATYTIRMVGDIETGDTSQDTYEIDCIYLHTYNETPISWQEWDNSSNPDTGTPWGWTFDFPDGTGYYQFYSIGNYSGSPESAPGSPDAICHINITLANEAPYFVTDSESPSDGQTGVQINPPLFVIVKDNTTTDSVNVSWYWNDSGTWKHFANNLSIPYAQLPLNITQTNGANFSGYETEYEWAVNVSDGYNWTNATYSFTTFGLYSGPLWYIDTAGSDVTGNGSIDNPYHTFKKAIDVASDGDTIYARGGRYMLSNETSPTSAAFGIYLDTSNMTISAYNNENVVIDGDGVEVTSGRGILGMGYDGWPEAYNVTIIGINISNSLPIDGAGAVTIYGPRASGTCGDGFTMINCTIYNATYYAIVFKTDDYEGEQIDDVSINNCTFNKIQTSESNGEAVAFAGCKDFEFCYNLMENCTKAYVDLSTNTTNGSIHHNWLYNNGTMNISTWSALIYLTGGTKDLPDWCHSSGHHVYNNYIQAVDGIGIAINCEQSGGSIDDVLIENNIVNVTIDQQVRYGIGMHNSGSLQSNRLSNITVQFNTIYIDGAYGWTAALRLASNESDYDNITIVNNIFVSNLTGVDADQLIIADYLDYPPENITLSNNLFNHTFMAAVALWNGSEGTYFGDDYVNATPEFVSTGDFHLTINSPAVDAANSSYTVGYDFDMVSRPQGSGYDIGAYEYESISVEETIGAVNMVVRFNVTQNSDKTYIRYNVDGEAGTTDTYVDPDEMNAEDRNSWLGSSSTDRIMIIRGLEPSTDYNYTIRINTAGSYYDYYNGTFTTLDRFTAETGYQDEFMDDYLWEANSSIELLQSIGHKVNGSNAVPSGSQTDYIRLTGAFEEDGLYHLISWFPYSGSTDDGFYINSSDPADFSGTWTPIYSNIDNATYATTGHQVYWVGEIGKYLLNIHNGTRYGTLLAVSDNLTYFVAVNDRHGEVLTDCESLDVYYLDGTWLSSPDIYGANLLLGFDNSHLTQDGDRVITDMVMFRDYDIFSNWTLAWGGNHVLGLRSQIRTLKSNQYIDTYSMGCRIRNGMYIGFVNLLYESGETTGEGPMDVYLAYSRDGYNWQYFDHNNAIIPRGSSGAFDDEMTLCWNWVTLENNSNTTNDWCYYTGFDEIHGSGLPPNNHALIGRIDYRINGFTYAEPTSSNAWIRTKAIDSQFCRNFTINGNFSSANNLTIEVLNATTGEVYNNFGADDFDVIATNSTVIEPTWGIRNLTHIPVGDYKLNFSFNGSLGELYAYTLDAGSRSSQPNEAPYFVTDSESPSDGQTGVQINPPLYVVVNDNNTADSVNVSWYWNDSGTWKHFANNLSIPYAQLPLNITQTNGANFSSYSTSYDWAVNVSDGTTYSNVSFSFTTMAEPDTTAPDITINFAGNPGDFGGPYYQPPKESGTAADKADDGYYTNNSKQTEDYIFINISAVDDESGVTDVWLNWLNGTTWTNWTYDFINVDSNFWHINTSGNISNIGEGNNYSFDVVANSTGGSNITQWIKIGVDGTNDGVEVRRIVQLNCTPTLDISNIPWYTYKAEYNHTGLQQGDRLRADRLVHDQGTDGTRNDTGFLKTTLPDDTITDRHCGQFVLFYIETDECIKPVTIENMYAHIWWTSNQSWIHIGQMDSRGTPSSITVNDDFNATRETAKSNISYDPADMGWGYTGFNTSNMSLNIGMIENINFDKTENNIYEFRLGVSNEEVAGGSRPVVISNRSFMSFVIINLPDNTTLKGWDNDSDNLNNYEELFVTFTNPYVADTDNDGVNDYLENLSGSDPNNYTDTTSPAAIDCEVSPVQWDLGNVYLGEFRTENFTFWQNGTSNIDITIGVNSTNFTFVTYSQWLYLGHDRYCANFTNDSWATEYNIAPGYPPSSVLKSNFPTGDFEFGVRIWTPRTMTTQKQEDFKIVLTISEST